MRLHNTLAADGIPAAEMLAELHDAAYLWAVTCCRNDQDRAEEILQISYWKILTGRAHYRGRASFKTWLFAVIRRTAAEEWRRWLFARLRIFPIEQATIIADPRPTPAEVTSKNQMALAPP